MDLDSRARLAEVLPGVATVIGGGLLLSSRNRATAMLGCWLSVLAGAWFVVGRALAGPLRLGDPGAPVASTATKQVWLELAYFSGLGAVIVFLGALALGRLSVRSVRDVQYVQRPVPATTATPAVAPTATTERTAPPPVTDPAMHPVAAPDAPVDGPRRRGFANLFRRRREKTRAAS